MSKIAIELHAVIKSMTSSDKKGFTVHCKLHKSDNMLLLFNVFKKLEKYDKDIVIKCLQKEGKNNMANNLASEISYLYKMVVEIFVSVGKAKSIANQLRDTFNKVVLLQERGFFIKSLRMLKKLKKDAIDYDQKILLLDICKYERLMIRNGFENKGFASLQEIKQMERELVRGLNLEVKLRDIYDDLFSLSRNISALEKNKVKEQLAEIEMRLSKVDQKECNSFNTKKLYLNAMAKLHELKSSGKEAVFRCMNEMQQLFDLHKDARQIYDFKYTRSLANYLYYLVKYNEPREQFLTILAKIRSIEIDTFYEEVMNFSDVDYLEFAYYLKQGDFVKLENLVPRLLEGLEKYGDQIEAGRKIALWYNLMIYYFLKQDFVKTNFWIKKIVDYGKTRRIDFYNYSRLLKLLVQYELEDIENFESLIRAIKRDFKVVDNSNELVDFITKLMNIHYKMHPLTRKDFKGALEQLYEIDKSKNRGLPYDEIQIWLKSKVERQSMQEIIKQML